MQLTDLTAGGPPTTEPPAAAPPGLVDYVSGPVMECLQYFFHPESGFNIGVDHVISH
jgi:hypothetical protein